MPSSVLDAALAAGVTVVTPNKRLARTLNARYDATMVAAGRLTWPAARVLPWQAWLEALWLEALAAGALTDPRPVASAAASAFLWDRIVARDADLLDPRGAAERAGDAWRTLHAWRAPGEAVDGWARSGIADDAAAFARWARQYAAALDERGFADAAQTADAVVAAAARVAAWRSAQFILAGFLEYSPQQQRLLAALRAAGSRLTELALPLSRAGRCVRTQALTPRSELVMALSYARARAQADAAATIGIVVANLDERRDEILAVADDLLCPALAERCASDASRPYNVSFGAPLADVPIVTTALALIAWAGDALPVADAAVALRSPYLPAAEHRWQGRAACEGQWRGTGLRTVSLAAAIGELHAHGDDALAARWRAAVAPASTRQAPAGWADAWRTWLGALGWPGDRPLGSGEWQARDAFLRTLGEFAALGPVASAMRRDEALAALRAATRRALFQPEATPARVQILGLLEAAGLDFDALWIAGLAAEQWPPAATPTPLLPLAWQRERGVPRADAARALDYARTLTATFARAGDDVIASHAVQVDGQERAASALVTAWPETVVAGANPMGGRAAQIAAARPVLEALADAIAPAVPDGSAVAGGVDIVESQSNCPFQAFARHRLAARSPDDTATGLSAVERGSLLHRTLAAFWQDVGDQAALLALDANALGMRIERAVAIALREFDGRRLRALPPPVAQAESSRLAATLRAWLDSVERTRPSFKVVATEAQARLVLGGIGLSFRVDRVDALTAGGVAIIDYKSGHAPGPSRWFAPRPQGTQVGLYALAMRERTPDEPVVAAAYAQLKAGSVSVNGLGATGTAWNGVRELPGARGVPLRAWSEVEPAWRAAYGGLAAECARGAAAVAPRNAGACAQCDLHALCRVVQLDDADTEGEAGDDE
jgi:ATP-dependent helicase/nuclease subunit B